MNAYEQSALVSTNGYADNEGKVLFNMERTDVGELTSVTFECFFMPTRLALKLVIICAAMP